jgi:hypothetical protein
LKQPTVLRQVQQELQVLLQIFILLLLLQIFVPLLIQLFVPLSLLQAQLPEEYPLKILMLFPLLLFLMVSTLLHALTCSRPPHASPPQNY